MTKKLIKYVLNRIIARKNHVIIQGSTDIRINNNWGGKNIVGENTLISRSSVGFATYIGSNCRLDMVSIGKYCAIGSNVCIISATHPTKQFVSIHPAFYSTRKQAGFSYVEENLFEEIKFVNRGKQSVIIENDVWIGDNVSILGGVTIHNGAIIGTGAVVTRDVLPYTIVGGVPAKKIGQRFEKKQIEWLINYKWWEKPEEWIVAHKADFLSIDQFIKNTCEDILDSSN